MSRDAPFCAGLPEPNSRNPEIDFSEGPSEGVASWVPSVYYDRADVRGTLRDEHGRNRAERGVTNTKLVIIHSEHHDKPSPRYLSEIIRITLFSFQG